MRLIHSKFNGTLRSKGRTAGALEDSRCFIANVIHFAIFPPFSTLTLKSSYSNPSFIIFEFTLQLQRHNHIWNKLWYVCLRIVIGFQLHKHYALKFLFILKLRRLTVRTPWHYETSAKFCPSWFVSPNSHWTTPALHVSYKQPLL